MVEEMKYGLAVFAGAKTIWRTRQFNEINKIDGIDCCRVRWPEAHNPTNKTI